MAAKSDPNASAMPEYDGRIYGPTDLVRIFIGDVRPETRRRFAFGSVRLCGMPKRKEAGKE